MADLSVSVAGYKVNVRVAALIEGPKGVLACRVPTLDWWFLPGGRIKVGESSFEALERELEEEIGAGLKVGKLVLLLENFFTLDGQKFHEICFLHRVEGQIEESARATAGDGELFEWIGNEELRQIDLRPSVLKKLLPCTSEDLKHIVHRDRG